MLTDAIQIAAATAHLATIQLVDSHIPWYPTLRLTKACISLPEGTATTGATTGVTTGAIEAILETAVADAEGHDRPTTAAVGRAGTTISMPTLLVEATATGSARTDILDGIAGEATGVTGTGIVTGAGAVAMTTRGGIVAGIGIGICTMTGEGAAGVTGTTRGNVTGGVAYRLLQSTASRPLTSLTWFPSSNGSGV